MRNEAKGDTSERLALLGVLLLYTSNLLIETPANHEPSLRAKHRHFTAWHQR